jgi:hypothetical protein
MKYLLLIFLLSCTAAITPQPSDAGYEEDAPHEVRTPSGPVGRDPSEPELPMTGKKVAPTQMYQKDDPNFK